LRNNALGDEGIAIIANILETTKSIVHIDLSCTRMTSFGADLVLGGIMRNKSLISVIMENSPGLYRNHIKSTIFYALREVLNENKTITILTLNGNLMGNETLKFITDGLKNNKSLLELNLALTGLDENCIDSLLEIFKISHLRYLNLSKNKFNYTVFFNYLNLC